MRGRTSSTSGFWTPTWCLPWRSRAHSGLRLFFIQEYNSATEGSKCGSGMCNVSESQSDKINLGVISQAPCKSLGLISVGWNWLHFMNTICKYDPKRCTRVGDSPILTCERTNNGKGKKVSYKDICNSKLAKNHQKGILIEHCCWLCYLKRAGKFIALQKHVI